MNFANKESIRQGIYKKINKHKDLKVNRHSEEECDFDFLRSNFINLL